MTGFNPAVIDETTPDDDAEVLVHAQAIGTRLRVLRHQLGWSLQDVELRSDQEITASELGAYEAGKQPISFFVFRRLVRLYGVSGDRQQGPSRTEAPGQIEGDHRVDDSVLPFGDTLEYQQLKPNSPVVSLVRAHCVDEITVRNQDLPLGTTVMVRTRYLGTWTHGFEIAELLDEGYRLRRLSDGSLLGDAIAFDDVQKADLDL